MIRSMTGYGQAEKEGSRFHIRVEIKSLNGKFLDISFRIPRSLNDKELILRNSFGKKLIRGSVLFQITLEKKEGSNTSLQADTYLLKSYYEQLAEVAEELNADMSGLYRTILGFPDVMRSGEEALNDNDWEEIMECCEIAFQELDAYRLREGSELASALEEHNHAIMKALNEQVEQYDAERKALARERLRQAFSEYNSESQADANRFEQELIFYLEKLDITEEKKRLQAHCELFSATLNQPESGKKLGFISQEMGREINTMGSKAYHAPLQQLIIGMKEDLEKIKEQSLNIL